jgi:membrane-associated phospholipid phosphatase
MLYNTANENRDARRLDQRRYWVGASLLLALASIAAIAGDRWTASQMANNVIPGDLGRIVSLSELFAHGFGVAVVLVALWTIAPELRNCLPRLAACAFVPGLIVNGLKLLVGRARPSSFEERIPDSQTLWVGWHADSSAQQWLNLDHAMQSFPSGHTATAFGLAIGLSWLFPRGRYLFFTLAILASFQRIQANAHWCSDVLAGAAIAVLVGGLIVTDKKLFTSIENRSL